MNRFTLPIRTSVLLVACVLSGCTAAPMDENTRAITDIEKLGGKIKYDENSPGRPVFSLDFSGSKITDDGLEKLKRLPQMKVLVLHGTGVTDNGLKHLKGLVHLRALFLGQTKVTDAGLEHLKGLTQLQTLALDHTEVTDASLKHLKVLTQLQKLDFIGTKITNTGAKHLRQALPKCDFCPSDAH